MKYNFNKFIFFMILAISGKSMSSPIYEGYGQFYSTTNQPKDKYIDKTIDIDRSKIYSKLDIGNNKKILLNTDSMKIKVFKDKDNINKVRILSEYDLYVNDKYEAALDYIYIVCPVTEEIIKDKSEIIEKKIINGKEITTLNPISETVSKKILYAGYYSFLSKPDERKAILPDSPDNNYLNVGININCMAVDLAIAKNELNETNRNKALKRFGEQQ